MTRLTLLVVTLFLALLSTEARIASAHAIPVLQDTFATVSPASVNVFAPGTFASEATVGGTVTYSVHAGFINTAPGEAIFFGGGEPAGDMSTTIATVPGRPYLVTFTVFRTAPTSHLIEVSAVDGAGPGGTVLATVGGIGGGTAAFGFQAASNTTTIRALGILGSPNAAADITLQDLFVGELPTTTLLDVFHSVNPDSQSVFAPGTFSSAALVGGPIAFTVHAGTIFPQGGANSGIIFFGSLETSGDIYTALVTVPGREYELSFTTEQWGGVSSHTIDAMVYDGVGLAGPLLGGSGPVGVNSGGNFAFTAVSSLTTLRFLGTVGSPNANEDLILKSLHIGTHNKLFQRGDCNTDGLTNIADPVYLLGYLFSGPLGVPVLPCEDACDSNDDGGVDLGDAIATLTALFSAGGAPLPAPTGGCGDDPTPFDGLECAGSASCP